VTVAALWVGLLSHGRLPTGPLALCFLAATKAMSVHAADSGDFSLPEISEFLHLLATAGPVQLSFLVSLSRRG